MIALIDGDIVAYRCGAVTEGLDVNIARWQTDELTRRIVLETGAGDCRIYLSGDNNFRYRLYPSYKANRRNMVRPEHLESIREHLVVEWGASITDGYEADDGLGIDSQATRESVVCSIDKDLLQLSGRHYNFVKREFTEVDELGGAKQFYTQLLTGDPTDNIRGCPGVGKVTAGKALYGCQSERDMYDVCCTLYQRALKDTDWLSYLNLQAQLLFIWRQEPDAWQPPVAEATQLSSGNLMDGSLEPMKA